MAGRLSPRRTLLAGVEQLLADTASRDRLVAVVVGTGPGAFTGLRVGLATAKTLAHALGVPIVGVGTGDALLADGAGRRRPAASGRATDRLVVRAGPAAMLLPARPSSPPSATTETLVARRPRRSRPGRRAAGARPPPVLGATLVGLGLRGSGRRQWTTSAQLVPVYVSLPRGVRSESGEVAWSRDPR